MKEKKMTCESFSGMHIYGKQQQWNAYLFGKQQQFGRRKKHNTLRLILLDKNKFLQQSIFIV